MNESMIWVAYALVTTFAAAAAVWFALVWHDAKMAFADLSVKYMKLFRDYSDAQAEASMATWYAKRALEAEAKLWFADEYGNDQYDNAQSRDARDVCLYQTFEQWLETQKGRANGNQDQRQRSAINGA